VSDDDDLYLPPPRSPVPVAVVTAVLTTVALFFGMRALDHRGLFSGLTAAGPSALGGTAAAVSAVGIDGDGIAEVPSVVGLGPGDARALLNARGLLLVLTGERFNPRRPAGSVGEQTPLPGSQAHRGDAVQVFLSLGTRTVRVPSLAGQRAEDVSRLLAAAELVAGTPKTVMRDGVAPGLIVETAPPEGTLVPAQSTITPVVSAPGPSKPVPRVTGLRLRAARDSIAQAGFKVGKIHYLVDGDRQSGIVLDQNPAADTPAPPASPVDLTVNDE
jgi:beta-lactam-binding protein with PASTA domain